MRLTLAIMLGLASSGCQRAYVPGETVTVEASGETEPVGTANEDAADDPAIWRNAADPEASLIVATDKKAGLYVYGLDGKVRSFDPAGRLNNVDLIDLGARGILVAASDRNDEANAKLRLYRLDAVAARLAPLGIVAAGKGEAYGICLAPAADGSVYAYSVTKEGTIEQIVLGYDGRSVSGRIVRSLSVPSQPEGCVVDVRTNQLFVGEEKAGIWRFDARADAPIAGQLVARVDGKHLVPDVEGLTLAPEGRDGGWLIASSQGDNGFAVFSLPDMDPAGRFRVVQGRVGSVEETDGIALALGDFGPAYPGGLFIAQDGANPPRAQNFKLLPWASVEKAANLR